MTKKRKPEAQPPVSTWDEMFKKLQSAGTGRAIYLKEGRTRVRLLAPNDALPQTAVREVTTFYRGKKKTKYAIPAINLDDAEQTEPKLLIMPKTCVSNVIGLLAEGYDLFGTEAHGVSIMRSGTGRSTAYNVVPSPKPIPVNEEFATVVTTAWLDKAIEAYNEYQAERNTEDPEKTSNQENEADW